MKLRMPLLLMIAALSFIELMSPVRLCGEGPRNKAVDLAKLSTAPEAIVETAGGTATANLDASNSSYLISDTSIASTIEMTEPFRANEGGIRESVSLVCTPLGRPCSPQLHSCCGGRACVFSGGSTRVGYVCR